MRSIMLCNDANSVHYVYSDEMLQQLAEIAGLDAEIYSRDAVLAAPEAFADVDYAFSTWGMPAFEEAEIQQLFPSLKAVFYGAGSVQAFARPFLNCGVKVFSAWAANAVPVAEYTVAQIILANKGFFLTSRLHKAYDHEASYDIRRKYPGNYGASIGIIGAGMIGKLVIQMLKNYHLPVKVFDPFLPDETAAELGVPKCSLEEVFSTCQVVSNHLANNEQEELNCSTTARTPQNITFITNRHHKNHIGIFGYSPGQTKAHNDSQPTEVPKCTPKT